jgi:hypothetical protein
MIGKKINQLATELAPLSTDLTIIGDPTTGVSKKITLEQISSLFGGSVSFYTNLAGFPAVGNIDIIYCAKDTNKLYLWSGSAYVEMFPSQALLDTYQLRSEKGNANGYASLDSGGKVPISQLPSSIMEYKGTWNAATNTPTLANGTGDTGDVYICNVAGTVNFGAGAIAFAVGDYVIYSGSIWQRSSGAVGTVTSVAATITGDSLTISGSPVTTSGTLAFAFNGTTAQYIRGNGTLETFPSLTGFVPYTGATANVDLGSYDLTTDIINLNQLKAVGSGGLNIYSNSGTHIALLGGGGGAGVTFYGGIVGTTGAFTSSGSTDTFGITHTSGSGVAASITKGGNGEALTVVKSSGSGNAASITGGVTLLDELHLNTDLADAYIASATNWNAAYNDKINSAAVTGTTTKTLTLTQQDGGTITASWTDDNTDAVTSVFGRTGAVVAVSGDYTTSLVTEGTNLYFTNARARAAISAGTGISYNSSTGVITNTITQYTDALARAAISLTTTGTSGAATYNNTTGVLNIPQYADQFVGTVTSVGLSAPTGFSVSGSPVTSSGTLALSFASGYSLPTTAKQTTWDTAYDRSLTAASVSGTTTKTLTLTKQDGSTLTASWTDDNTDAVTSVFGRTGAVVATSGDYTTAQVTENTNLYFTNARAIASTLTGYTSGAGTITSSDSILSAIQKLNGNIGALTTGVSSVNGLTGAVTLTTSNIAEGTNLYYTEARVNANTNVAANTAARHNAVTIGTANGLSLSTQVLSLGLASTSTTGALSSTDWNTFNNKTSNTGTVTSVGLSSATSGVTIGSTPITTSGTITLAIATASGSQQGLLSSTDWTTFNNKQNALTNPVTGTGTTNYLPKFTGTSTIGNSQIIDNGTNVGIGTTSPDSKLHILDGAGNSLRIGFLSGTSNFNLYDAAIHTFRNNGGTTEYMRLNASGNLSIGNTNDTYKLDVTGTGRFTGDLNILKSSGAYATITTDATTGVNFIFKQGGVVKHEIFTNTTQFAIYNSTTGAVALGIANATGAATFSSSVTSNGNTNGQIAISPSTNTNAAAFVASNAGGGCYFGKNNITGGAFTGTAYATVVYSGGDVPMAFYTNDAEKMRITSGGNVGIGTTSPTGLLHIYGTDPAFRIQNSGTGNMQMGQWDGTNNRIQSSGRDFLLTQTDSFNMLFHTNSTERMRITSGGNVVINTSGTSAPNSGQLVNRQKSDTTTPYLNGIVNMANGSSKNLTIWYDGNNNVHNINATYYTGGDGGAFAPLAFQTSDTERMRITIGGNVEINTGSIKTGEPDTGYGRAAVKIGARNTGQAFDSGGHLPVNIDGTIYYINLYSSLP